MSRLSRRGLLGGILTALAAPAIIRTPGLLMPIKAPPVSAPLLLTPGPGVIRFYVDWNSNKVWIVNGDKTYRSVLNEPTPLLSGFAPGDGLIDPGEYSAAPLKIVDTGRQT